MDPWKIHEGGAVCRHDDPPVHDGSGSDDQVVRSPRRALSPCESKEIGMRLRHVYAVVEYRYLSQHVVDESLSGVLATSSRKSHAHQ